MTKKHYYVALLGVTWRLRIEGSSEHQDFPSEFDALGAAIAAARADWLERGIPGSVLLQQAYGRWREVQAFGSAARSAVGA